MQFLPLPLLTLTPGPGLINVNKEMPVLAGDPDYILRRKNVALTRESQKLRQKRGKPNRFTRFKNATLNWLNGLPPVDYDSALQDFNAENSRRYSQPGTPLQTKNEPQSFEASDEEAQLGEIVSSETKKRRSLKKKLKKLRRLFLRKDKKEVRRTLDEGTELLPFEAEDKESKVRVQELLEAQYLESRQKIREIFLPPDFAAQKRILRELPKATRKAKKAFTEAHPWTVSNEIHSAKYTILNFLPKNLFEQFRRVANVYFLILIILQAIPIFSNTNVFLAASPLVSILIITAIKDAMEDWKRQKSDRRVNHTISLVLKRGDATPLLEDEEDQQQQHRQGKIKQFVRSASAAALALMNRALFREKIAELTQDGEEGEGRNSWQQKYWKDVRVGDILLVKNNESIPADLIVLATSDAQRICYVETKNLDGETNLKIRQAPAATAWIQTADQAASLNAVLQVEPPSTRLYTFSGKMVLPVVSQTASTVNVDAEAIPLTSDNLLLRGCQIRNTEYVIGLVAYTGEHSKIIMNSGNTPSKRSRIERQMNPQIILSFVLLFVICMTCAITQGLYVGGSIANAPYWYTVYKTGPMSSPIFTGFLTFWSSLILFQTLVPISLYITVEFCKLIQALWINLDLKMFYAERNQRAVPRAWNIADDLGQIEYIFSDKTGTLTRNVMEFRKCSIGGKAYGYLPGSDGSGVTEEQFQMMEEQMIDCLTQVLPYNYIPPSQLPFVDTALIADMLSSSNDSRSESIRDFFFAVIVCHTILIDRLSMDEEEFENLTQTPAHKTAPHLLQYQAQSPDEAALVKAARDLGFVFLGRENNNQLTLCILGEIQTVQVLQVIEFNSTRKRMSVIVRKQDGSIWLFCKGADSVITERLCQRCRESETTAITTAHLEDFAEDGLRTLCFASRKLSEREFDDFSARYSEASCSVSQNRELLMDAVAEEYERELEILGASAIEDRLQDGVPDCIATLQAAGIKIWVLTGDKMETAVNIGFSCRLLTRSMFLIMIRSEDSSVESTRRQLEEGYQKLVSSSMERLADLAEDESGIDHMVTEYALIIDGTSLKHALDDRECRPVFLDLATACRAVLCCRVSPLQKAKVVELIKKTRNVMTLAIGDGANDVSMIQEADVGVGIAGEEGMQAVMSSDYAIAQFAYLERLLLVHGRLSYVRTAKITLLCFCKNVSFVLVAFWYQIYCAFTAQYTYDYMYLLFFNMIFTMLPVLAVGLFDRQCSDANLIAAPQLYRDGIKQRYYSMKLFCFYSAIAIYQSLVCFFLPMLILSDTAIIMYGFPETKTLVGHVQGFATIISINLFMAMHMESWNWPCIAAMVLTFLVFIGFVLIYLLVPLSDMYRSWGDFATVAFWGTLIVTIAVCLIPSLLFPYVRGWIFKRPSDIEIVREMEHLQARKKREVDVESGAQGEASSTTLLSAITNTLAQADDKSKSLQTGASAWNHRGNESVAVPERLVVGLRTEGTRRIRSLSASSNEFVPEEEQVFEEEEDEPVTHSTQEHHHRKSSENVLNRKSTLRRLQRNFKLFNLRSGDYEQYDGFAFSQEERRSSLTPLPKAYKK